MATYCLYKIVLNSDLMASRERINDNVEEELTYRENLKMKEFNSRLDI